LYGWLLCYISAVIVFVRAIAPRLTLYLCVEQSSVYHALYLDSLSCAEMASKLAQLMGISAEQIHDIYVQGPGGIHVLIADDVVRNIKDEAMFTIEILQGKIIPFVLSILKTRLLHCKEFGGSVA
jgi:transcription factor CP2-like protein